MLGKNGMNLSAMTKLVQGKFTAMNAVIRSKGYLHYTLLTATQHFRERMLERVDPEDYERVLNGIVNYVLTHNVKLSHSAMGENVVVKSPKYVIELMMRPGVSTPLDPRDKAHTIAQVMTVKRVDEARKIT